MSSWISFSLAFSELLLAETRCLDDSLGFISLDFCFDISFSNLVAVFLL